ncbi:FMN-binding protein [Natronospora cellulosivora (SeqCode)]
MKKLLFILTLILISFSILVIANDRAVEDIDLNLYLGYSQFSRGYVEAQVELDGDKIVSVNLTEYDALGLAKGEDYRLEEQVEAIKALPERFVEANDYNVDAYTGATSTSNKAMEAVKMALAKAAGETEFDGTYMGISEPTSRNAWGIAIVTFEDGKLVDLSLEESSDGELKDENYSLDAFHEAKPAMTERMIEANSSDVDTFSGATSSSNLWIEAVENAFDKAGISNDIYLGYSQFSRGYVEAQVELDGDKIVSVNLTEYDALGLAKGEDYRLEEQVEAIKALPERFVEANDYNVDAYTGATSTSNKAMEAVKMALAKAAGETEFDGTYMGISEPTSRNAWGIAIVTFEDGKLVDLSLEESSDGELKDENYSLDAFHEAKPAMTERMIEANSSDVDTFSGATSSSNLWIEAVENAFDKAGL